MGRGDSDHPQVGSFNYPIFHKKLFAGKTLLEITVPVIQMAVRGQQDILGGWFERQFGRAGDIDQDVFDVLTLEGSVNARDITGGTAPNQVRFQIKQLRGMIAQS